AMGVAALTAMLDTSQSQLLADRAGMTVPETFALSGVPRTGATELALYQKLQSETFVSAMDQQFVLVALLTMVSVGLALMMRSGRAPAGGGPDDSAAVMH
ncbi:MAG: hypothetical protein HOV83_05895, partial [Catenulispora sp.]|nr:hypothetical protein [Catenulispora sp.]